MNFDLATILVICIIITLLIWLYDAIFLANKSKQMHNVDEKPFFAFIVDLSKSLLPVFVIVLILRSFLVEPFRIPSGSMMPTLLVGDFILVNKYVYGIRLPVLNKKIISIGEPERGDVVVFRYPEDLSIPFIKRVVAIPGDNVYYDNESKYLYVNGEIVDQRREGIYHGLGAGSNMTGAELRNEYLTENGHQILVVPRHIVPIEYDRMTLGDGQYFVLGDNRDNSRDSRYWGVVSDEDLIGKAFLIWMNLDWSAGGIAWERLGNKIQ